MSGSPCRPARGGRRLRGRATELDRERARASPVAAWSCWSWRRRSSPASENSPAHAAAPRIDVRWPSRCQDSGWAVDSSIGCCRNAADGVLVVQRRVHQRVGPGLVGADVDQVLRGLAGREDLAQGWRRPSRCGRALTLDGDPGDGAEHVHGREVPGDGELAVQHHVPVQDGAGGVGDRVRCGRRRPPARCRCR